MKTPIALVIGIVCSCSLTLRANYADQPVELAAQQAEIVVSYEKQARETLPVFDREFSPLAKKAFFIVTKLHQGNFSEQIYVRVQSKTKTGYHGTVDSAPMGRIDFRRGDSIDVPIENVADWVIVSPNGEEEGNLTGKAIEALAAKSVVFIFSMKPANGKFSQFSIVAVHNPRTHQDIRDIVPESVLREVEQEARKRFGDLKAADEKEKFQFILAAFPGWKFIPPQ